METEIYNDAGQLHCTTGPAIIYEDGTKEWYCEGELHRDDGPAIECADGGKEWVWYGELHRDNGPAVIYYDGKVEWHVMDEQVHSAAEYMRLTNTTEEEMAVLILKYGAVK